jgi:integrase
MEPKTYTNLPDGRIYRWVRVKPGKDGRKAVKGWTPEEVEEKASALLEAAARSREPSEYYEPGTFGWFVMNVYCPRTYEGKPDTTVQLYDVYLRYHLLPVLGDTPIDGIGYEHFVSTQAGLKNQRNPKLPLAPKTKREIMMRLHEIMNLYALLESGRGGAPREDWRVHKPPKAPKKKKREEVGADYSLRLMEAARGTYMEGPIFCMVFLALRRGEICGLRTSALDRKNMRIKVEEQIHPRLKPGAEPKAGKKRDIPVPPEVFAAIDRLRDKSSTYVWTHKGKPINPDNLTHDVTDLTLRAGIARKTPHELRSLAATNLLGIGANPVAVMEILGHAELDTSLIYLDPRATEKQAAFSLLLKGFGAVDEQADAG